MNKAFPAIGSMASVADDLENFLIAKASVLAAEFAAGQISAVPPAAPTSPAWMQEIAEGEVLTTNDAMVICDVTTSEAVRQRCMRADDAGTPIAICFAGAWLIDRNLLLASLGAEGSPARLAAESRAKKLPKFGSKQILGSENDRNLV